MLDIFACPPRTLRPANRLLGAGLALLLLGLSGAYGLDRRLDLALQVGAHALVILGPSLLKIGYVMRLAAQQRLRAPAGRDCPALA